MIDFSVNINPLGIPNKIKELWPNLINQVADYPDPKNKELIKVLSEKLAIDPVHLLLGNGAAELISLLGLYLHKKSIRSEEHTSELQSRFDLVCRLLLEKKNYTLIIKDKQ